MANDITDLIDKFRRLINKTHPVTDETDSLNSDENEPGQLIDEGDVNLTYVSSYQGEPERTQAYIQTIDGQLFRREVKHNGSVLLDMFNSNAIYLCDKSEMDNKVSEHITQTGAYSLIEELNNTNTNCVQQTLDNIVKQVTSLLNDFLERQCLTNIQVQQIKIERSTVQMDYLYFSPDARQEGTPFQPVMICCLGPTIGISRYIDRLLQPIYDQVACSTTFFKETNAVHVLENYAKQGLLRSNTLFATLHVNNLCTVVPHEQSIEALQRFLNEYAPDGEIQGLTIATIIQLSRFVLQNQYFIFNKKMYRQIKGCGSGLPLNHLLAKISMFYWQEDLVKMLVNKKEIFGRCIDEIFLTWNGSKNELEAFINTTINKKYPTLSITTTIGKKVNYLNVQISHVNGQLRTKINHDNDVQPRALPFISDHPPLMYSTLIQASLIRAALVCSKVSDFQAERRDIEMVFIANGYTINYIKEHVEQFFRDYHVSNWISDFNQNTYETMRQQIVDCDQQRKGVEVKQRKEEQSKQKWYITSVFNGDALINLRRQMKRLWQDYFDDESQFNDINIEIIHQPKYPSNTK